MIPDKLKTLDYYLDKLPMYMRNSYGVDKQTQMILDILIALDNCGDNILAGLNLKDAIEDTNDKYDDLLDKIASLYGLQRDFTVAYNASGYPEKTLLHLTFDEYVILILCAIFQNNYVGTFKSSKELYDILASYNYQIGIAMMQVSIPLIVQVILLENDFLTDNIKALFYSGYLTLKSMGITYQYSITKDFFFAKWDENTWDSKSYKWF